MKSAKAIIKSVTMFASWFASIDISEDKDITFIELQQFLTRSIVGKRGLIERKNRPRVSVLQLQSLFDHQILSLIRELRPVTNGCSGTELPINGLYQTVTLCLFRKR